MVVDYFSDVTLATAAQSDNVDMVQLDVADSHTLTVLWSRLDLESIVEIIATGEKAYLLDQYGNKSIIRPVDGTYRLNLAPAKCNDVDGCPVGGAVSILIQPQGIITVEEREPNQVTIFEG